MIFASQVALVIFNPRRYRNAQRARASLKTLVNGTGTSNIPCNGFGDHGHQQSNGATVNLALCIGGNRNRNGHALYG